MFEIVIAVILFLVIVNLVYHKKPKNTPEKVQATPTYKPMHQVANKIGEESDKIEEKSDKIEEKSDCNSQAEPVAVEELLAHKLQLRGMEVSPHTRQNYHHHDRYDTTRVFKDVRPPIPQMKDNDMQEKLSVVTLYTDDQYARPAKTAQMNLNKRGVVPATGTVPMFNDTFRLNKIMAAQQLIEAPIGGGGRLRAGFTLAPSEAVVIEPSQDALCELVTGHRDMLDPTPCYR